MQLRTIPKTAYHMPALLASAVISFSAGAWAETAEVKPPNVLFIAVDDLRPELKSFGQEHMVTPHMDALAERGRAFSRHYVEAPTCGAARYALLTGQYPKSNTSYGNGAFRRYQDGLAPPSFPQIFREHGYHTVQMGKVSHSPDGLRDDLERIAKLEIRNTYNNAPHKHFTNPADPEVP
ncbi:MAG: sulfatase-like hydrolase/transferase, partial [Opitutales bacterium]